MASASAAGNRRGKRRRIGALPITALILLLAGGGWYFWSKLRPTEDKNTQLITAQVTRGDLIETVSATGSVTAETGAQVKISSQITGRIKRLYADVGAQVKAGQIIAELDLPDVQAQVQQAQANVAAAQSRLHQAETSRTLTKLQNEGALQQAKAAYLASQSRLASVQAAATLQTTQTPTSIRRAETELRRAEAALSTARTNLKQIEASVHLQVATAEEQVTQARANAHNSALNLSRQKDLLAKGFVAASLVDAAEAANTVNQSQVRAAEQNLALVQERTKADLQAARDQLKQAEESLEATRAALEAARAGTFQDKARLADVEDAKAQVRQSEANLKVAQANLTQVTLREQEVQAARDQVRVAEAQLAQARVQADRAFIRSPISGTVLQLASQQGEVLPAGLTVQTVIVVADLNRLEVNVYVDETDIGKIKIGQETQITVDAFPRQKIPGKVVKVASGSTIQQGVITYSVTVALKDKKLALKPDMTASVTIETGKRSNVLLVPSEAVKVGVRGSTVNIAPKGKDSKAEPESRPVKVGATDGVNTEILEGLTEGETVVLAGMNDPNRRRLSNNPFGPQQPRGGGGGGGRMRM
jgi:RND family efflux transporter MFP subunit